MRLEFKLSEHGSCDVELFVITVLKLKHGSCPMDCQSQAKADPTRAEMRDKPKRYLLFVFASLAPNLHIHV